MIDPNGEIMVVSITERGRDIAAKVSVELGYESRHGDMAQAVRDGWVRYSGFVLFAAVGAAVRIIAPLLDSKDADPAVVCVDEMGRFAVAVCGGHQAGANTLAVRVASVLGAVPVVTTATDSAGLVGLDTLDGLVAVGDLAAATRAWLDGRPPVMFSLIEWPLPPGLSGADLIHAHLAHSLSAQTDRVHATLADAALVGADLIQSDLVETGLVDELLAGSGLVAIRPATGADPSEPGSEPKSGGSVVVLTDRCLSPMAGVVALHPSSLVLGVGTSTGAPGDEVAALVKSTLAAAGLAPESVSEVATIDRRATAPAVIALGYPVRCFTAQELARVEVPHPSEVVRGAVGTPSVAEAAALAAAGPDGTLVVPKTASASATVAIARRSRPRGQVTVVGLGPGHRDHRTPAAARAVATADAVIGYGPYLAACADLIRPHSTVEPSPIGAEEERAAAAISQAIAGLRVAVVCSGDSGIYAMATLVLAATEAASLDDPRLKVDVEIIPGVTAATAAAALLGAPLAHDHASISLSDLRTPWPDIERRIRAAAESDLVVSFYNPRSKGRHWQLTAALSILARDRKPTTPVGLVHDATRPDQRVEITELAKVDPESVGMTTCVIVGSTATRIVNGRMVTPR